VGAYNHPGTKTVMDHPTIRGGGVSHPTTLGVSRHPASKEYYTHPTLNKHTGPFESLWEEVEEI